ncbi:uncharacterized protein LOC127898858 [Citrus sinensis]|uniref:uncharacterized protein LOC112099009 n=1 Tax=Citrus clementina TaxID=85681 RepID=UPI000CECE6B8|nr:uncharacterized protein LOC112099009 [Citrus x clementina]XP_052287310.1 uncharacterized protein LOC127898858 [Citrus sinensis]
MESSENLGREGNPISGGIFPPPFREARMTKKVRFRDEEHAGDPTAQVSYKETLVNATQAMEQGVGGGLDDWDFEEGDVTKSNEGSMPSITFSARVHAKLSEPWKNSVVVKLLGRTIGYRALCARLNGMWKSAMGFSVIDLENNYYLVRFRSVGDAMDALTKGPWLVMGHYLTVQPWTPSFDFTNTALEQVTVWIRLPGLAVHLYDRKVLQKLGQLVGNVITIDSNTASSSRGRFARLAVSISLTRPLVSQFELDGKIQKVEYEGLPVICYKCGLYEHSSSNCKDAKNSTSSEEDGQSHQAMPGNEAPGQHAKGCNGDSTVEPFGPWMMAPRRGRKPNNGRVNTGDLNRNREFTGAGTSREVATDHIERQGSDPQPLADPPNNHNTSRVKEGGHVCNHPDVPMSGMDGDGMTDDEISMVQETPLALMDDVSGQQQ